MTGQLLFGAEIASLATDNAIIYPPSATSGTKSNSLRNISVDFTVGAILIPGTAENGVGGTINPATQISLKQGHTAVIRTAEKLSLPMGVGAICFPPSSDVSLPGLLTTNPGVIDPGFTGPLHLTVINMGKADFPLKVGDRILRVLLFKDASIVGSAKSESSDPVTKEILERLSHDFLNVEQRATQVADKVVGKAELNIKRASIAVPIIASILAALISYFSAFSPLKDRIADNKADLTKQIEAVKDDVSSLKAKQDSSTSFASINDRLKRLEVEVKRREGSK